MVTVTSGDCVQDGGGPGTVTAVPSWRQAARGFDSQGVVDVRWDSGDEGPYSMGRDGQYRLDLA